MEKYRDQCRQSYLNDYDSQINIISDIALSTKRPWEAILEDEDDSDQEYEHLCSNAPPAEEAIFNEYDHYIALPNKKMGALIYWRSNSV